MIVIPMAGLSSRFTAAGYTVPKYQLPLGGRSVFAHSVASFEAFFDDEPFLFIVRNEDQAYEFVRSETEALGIKNVGIYVLDKMTRGQAETVAIALKSNEECDDNSVTIFNIDTFRPGFRYPKTFKVSEVAGYLEVFEGSGANWSYVRGDERSGRVFETAEKVEISNLCCTGLYHFASAKLFLETFNASVLESDAMQHKKELYIAPLYNDLIARGLDIRFEKIDSSEALFCGVPQEYEFLQTKLG